MPWLAHLLAPVGQQEAGFVGSEPSLPSMPTLDFLLPLAERLRKVGLRSAVRTLALISLGLYAHYWLLLNVSGFRSPGSALLCMLVTRSLLAHPYLHVNIFQVRPLRPGPQARLGVLGKEREALPPTSRPSLPAGYHGQSGFQAEFASPHPWLPFTTHVCIRGTEYVRNFSAQGT